ncbi:MAG: 5-oxoprolinase subunit PxpB, partial [Thermodesulfobacteriota bacterium]
VARYHQISPEKVIQLHCSKAYLIYMIGFMPGYPYMGELPEELVTPRLKTPRLVVPKGSVAIAQRQTGIYSMESPGGWQIIGRTPVELFDPGRDPPSLLQMGDFVQFYQISEKELKKWHSG